MVRKLAGYRLNRSFASPQMSSCIPEKGNPETYYIAFLKWIDPILTEQTKHWMCHCLSKALSALKGPIFTHLVQR